MKTGAIGKGCRWHSKRHIRAPPPSIFFLHTTHLLRVCVCVSELRQASTHRGRGPNRQQPSFSDRPAHRGFLTDYNLNSAKTCRDPRPHKGTPRLPQSKQTRHMYRMDLTPPTYYQSRGNGTGGKSTTRFCTQRLKLLLWCGILRKQVSVSFRFVRIKQPSSRLTLAALRQAQKKTARAAETCVQTEVQIQLVPGRLKGHVGCRINSFCSGGSLPVCSERYVWTTDLFTVKMIKIDEPIVCNLSRVQRSLRILYTVGRYRLTNQPTMIAIIIIKICSDGSAASISPILNWNV